MTTSAPAQPLIPMARCAGGNGRAGVKGASAPSCRAAGGRHADWSSAWSSTDSGGLVVVFL